MEDKNLNPNKGQRTPPRAVKPVGTRPRPVSTRPNNIGRVGRDTNVDAKIVTQQRESIVDVDAVNEKYFIDDIGYDEVIDDDVTKSMDIAEAKQRAKQVTPEQAKKRKIIGISAGCGGAVLIAGLVVINILKSDTGFDITKADITGHEPVYIAGETLDYTVDTSKKQEPTEDTDSDTSEPTTENTGDNVGETEEPRVERTYTIVEAESGKEYAVGNFITTEFIVEYKPVDAEEYIAKNTKYDCGLEGVYFGDTVNKIIEQYNENNAANKEITIDFESISDSTFAVVRVGCQYPEDYPTSDGRAYKLPVVDIKIVGTYIEPTSEVTTEETTEAEMSTTGDKVYSDKVELNEKIYTLEAPIILHDVPKSISVASGYSFDYLVQMPSGTKADNYKIIVTINGQEIIYSGVDIE